MLGPFQKYSVWHFPLDYLFEIARLSRKATPLRSFELRRGRQLMAPAGRLGPENDPALLKLRRTGPASLYRAMPDRHVYASVSFGPAVNSSRDEIR